MLALAASFFLIALLYSMVGFGGGSSYIALLAAASVPYTHIPRLSLICNLLVVTGGLYHAWKNNHLKWSLTFPFILGSIPMAFLGGQYQLQERSFFIILTVSLILGGLRLLILPDRTPSQVNPPSFFVSLAVGAALGLLAGVVGIGGGIFLSPLLMNLGWARSKTAAAVASAFIFFNSLAGLAGQLTKSAGEMDIQAYIPLFIAVVIGGQIGARVGNQDRVSYGFIQKATGVLTLFICVKLLLTFF